jgi:hypothetical protein
MKKKNAPEPIAAPEPRKPQRVEIINNSGAIARPFEKDLASWLAKGWRRVEMAEKAE